MQGQTSKVDQLQFWWNMFVHTIPTWASVYSLYSTNAYPLTCPVLRSRLTWIFFTAPNSENASFRSASKKKSFSLRFYEKQRESTVPLVIARTFFLSFFVYTRDKDNPSIGWLFRSWPYFCLSRHFYILLFFISFTSHRFIQLIKWQYYSLTISGLQLKMQ